MPVRINCDGDAFPYFEIDAASAHADSGPAFTWPRADRRLHSAGEPHDPMHRHFASSDRTKISKYGKHA
jgi:hypothetical protein